jgi:hypothetical protein
MITTVFSPPFHALLTKQRLSQKTSRRTGDWPILQGRRVLYGLEYMRRLATENLAKNNFIAKCSESAKSIWKERVDGTALWGVLARIF